MSWPDVPNGSKATQKDALNSGKHTKLGTMLAEIGRELGGVELEIQRDETLPEPADFGLGIG